MLDERQHSYSRKEIKLNQLAEVFALSNSLLICKNILVAGNSWLALNNTKLNIIILIISFVLYAKVLVGLYGKKCRNDRAILCVIGILIAWIFALISSPEIFLLNTIQEAIQNFLVYCFPAIIFLAMLPDCKALLESYYRYRWLMLGCTVITVLQILVLGQIQGSGSYTQYNMAFGRALILPTTLFFSKWFLTWKIKEFSGAAFCLITIFLFCSRFPILCILAFILIKVWQLRQEKKVSMLIIIGAFLGGVVFIAYKEICGWLHDFLLSAFGINSRMLYLIKNGYFTYSAGRDIIYDSLIEGINESPILGHGIGGANIILNDESAHSFVLDVFATFGYIFGGILLALAIVNVIKLFRKNRSFYNREFILICVASFLPICTIQMSLWDAQYFWYLIALGLGKLKDRKV